MATKAEMFRYLSERAALCEQLRREALGESATRSESVQAGKLNGPALLRGSIRPSEKKTERKAERHRNDGHRGRLLASLRPNT